MGIVCERTTAAARLLELLCERGIADAAAVERARAVAPADPIHLVLVRLGLVPERAMAEALADALGLPLAAPADWPSMPVLPERLGERFLRQAMALPLAERGDGLLLAMADPLDDFALGAVALAAGRPALPVVALPSEVAAALDRLYGEGARPPADAGASEEDIARLRDRASEAPVIRLANALIDRAVAAGASDLHIEPMAGRLQVRLRVDGVLRQSEPPPRDLHPALASRLKLMAGLDIAERRLPQDGRIRIASHGREIDLRLATMPTLHGESLAIRLLDRAAAPLDLPALGFAPAPLAALARLLALPNGIILVTGPTGSGKTSTLYAALRSLDAGQAKLMSVEDPVEYHLEGVTQIQVKPAIGLDFATVLRAVLRHDPDIVMVGEIRDRQTAEIAVQAALTGHLVLSTLHTNGAADTVNRLLDMGVADYLLAPTVAGIAAQRLVRLLCPACRRPLETPPDWLARLLDQVPDGAPRTPFQAVGCPACGGTGYRGRTAVAEVMVMDEAVRALVVARAPPSKIARAAAAAGMVDLFQDGLAKVAAGLTTIEEVLRVGREA